MNPLLMIMTGTAALGAGAVGGVFYAFSTFVMPGLRALPAAEGTAAMQKINIHAVRPGLMIPFLGTAAVCIATVAYAGATGSRRTVAVLVGSALYLVGTIGLTVGYNVPLNNGLAARDPADPATEPRWRDYARRWTVGNHARTAASLAAAAAFLWTLAQDD